MTTEAASPMAASGTPTETEAWILRCAEGGTLKRYENGSWSGDAQWMDAGEEAAAEEMLTDGRVVVGAEPGVGWPYRMVRAATPVGSETPTDLVGKTVRWENPQVLPGYWFTARVLHANVHGGYVGVVVDIGTYYDEMADIGPGSEIDGLHPPYLTVIDSEPVTEDEECE